MTSTSSGRKYFKWIVAIVVFIALIVIFFRPSSDDAETRSLSRVITDVKQESVSKIEVAGDRLEVHLKDGAVYKSRKEQDTSLVTVLRDSGATNLPEIEVEGTSLGSLGLVFTFLPLILFAGLIYCCVRKR